MYQISGSDKIEDWLSRHENAEHRQQFLDWLPQLAEDPVGVSMARRKRPGVPVFVAEVPGLPCWVTYSVIEQYRAVHILRIDEPPNLSDEE